VYRCFRLKWWLAVLAAAAVVVSGTAAVVAASAAVGGPKLLLPVIMYHSIYPSRTGQYVLSPADLESDLKYIKDNGFHSITVADLLAYTKGGALPDKPIMITFDDGHLNNLTYAVALLQKYGMKGVFSIVGSYTDKETVDNRQPSYSYMNWDEVNQIIASGNEIQCHSYDLHQHKNGRVGADKKKSEDAAAYLAVIRADTEKFQQDMLSHTGKTATAYAYPFGACSKASEATVTACGFGVSFSCYEILNKISDAKSLHQLGRFNRPSGVSTESFFKKVLKNYK